MKQRVFLTGHRGYLGRCLAHLIHHDPNLTLVTHEGRLEKLSPESFHCDAVIHAASRKGNANRDNDNTLIRENREATHALIAALQKPTPIVYTSSVSVYAKPTTAYGESKQETEQCLQASHHPVSCLRVSTLWGYGVHCYGNSFLDHCLQKVLTHQPIELFTEPAWRKHLFVWDAARWIHQMVSLSLHTPLLNMAGEPIILQEKIRAICTHAPAPYVPIIRRKQGESPSPLPLMDTTLWEALRQQYHFKLTPWSMLEKQAWQQKVHHV